MERKVKTCGMNMTIDRKRATGPPFSSGSSLLP